MKRGPGFCVVAALAAAAAAAKPAAAWTHGWNTSADMTFADFQSRADMTDEQVAFANDKYQIISLEKCSGILNGTYTEDFVYSTARRLKRLTPGKKVIFYWATDQQGIGCYRANSTFGAHPEWLMKDDNGTVVYPHRIDPSIQAARDWWTSVPLGGINGTGLYDGIPVDQLIDGVLADGSCYSDIPNIATSRLETISDAKRAMVGALQSKFTAANDGVVMANGITMYGGPNADPRDPDDHNVKVLSVAMAVMNEHTAAFESVNGANASFNVETVKQNLEAIDRAAAFANGSRTVFIQTWPGLYSGVQKYPPVSAGGEPTPTNNDEWRNALRSHFPLAQAVFLSVAEENVFWFYGGTWYTADTGYIACPEDPSSCPAPPEWCVSCVSPRYLCWVAL